MTAERRFDFPAGAALAGIRFRPGVARAFLGVPPAELTDGLAPLEDLWPFLPRDEFRANMIVPPLEESAL